MSLRATRIRDALSRTLLPLAMLAFLAVWSRFRLSATSYEKLAA